MRTVADIAMYLLRGSKWERISGPGPSPHYLTTLAFDTKRNQVILHGAGPARRELWTVRPHDGKMGEPPAGRRIPGVPARSGLFAGSRLFLTYGAELWEYSPSKNSWRRTTVAEPTLRTGQNRAMVHGQCVQFFSA